MKTVVIKAGGRAAESSESILMMAEEIKMLTDSGWSIIFVHGGGAAVSQIQKTYGLEPRFVDGKRLTSVQEMDLVDMGLAGLMNKHLVRLFHKKGLKAVGLSGADGGLILSSAATGSGKAENRTGSVEKVNPELIKLIMDSGYFPVLSSVSSDPEGKGMNINADEAALAVATAVEADSLIFISDIPGIMIDGAVMPHMDEASIEKYIGSGDIKGGMIPKVRSSLAAIRQGAQSIRITNYEKSGDLKSILDETKGTCITLETKI